MKKRLVCIGLALALLAGLSLTAAAEDLELPAPSCILMEKQTGQVLYESNAHEKLRPASVTKVMTLLLVMEALESGSIGWDDTVTTSAAAAAKGGSQIYLEENEQLPLTEMLKSVVVSSANDCACALAEHVAGSEAAFVSRMNDRAAELGMTDTHFVNCTGLDDGPDADTHLTTAYDIALMSRALLQHDEIKQYTTIWMDTVRNGQFGLSNTNKLVRFYDGTTGLKTGYTSQAGYCLSASAERGGMELIAVVMHCKSSVDRFESAKALLNYGKTGLVIVKPTFGGEQIEIQARLSFRKDDNYQLQLVPHFVRNEPKLDVAYKGYTFTPEDKKNLLQNGNLGKVVDFPDKNTGELRPHFISIDRLTNEIVDIPTNKVRIPDTIGKTPITKDDKRVLYSGIPLRKEIELANGRKFTPLLQVNVEQRGVEFVPGSTRQAQGQKQNGDKKQTADKQEQKAEGDAGGQKKQQDPNHWLNEDGTIRRLNTYFKKELTEQQKDDYVAGKTIEIKEVPNKNGSGTYTAYVKFDFDKMQPRSYRNNPDLKQAKEQIPTNENKVQVAVNEQGKTHEATKHTKDPLSPGQSAPKNEKQQKEQNAEEQKPKRKARSVKM